MTGVRTLLKLAFVTLTLAPLFGATVTTDQTDYSPGQTVTITGAGFQPGEPVTLRIDENPDLDGDSPILWTVTADGSGGFTDTSFLINNADLGITFALNATGQSSGLTAPSVTFTDARNWALTFAGTGSGSVTITPSTGTVNAPATCGGTGANAASQTVTSTCSPNITTSANGATVTFNSSAAGGSVFAGWSGQANLSSSTCSGTTNPCSAVLGGNAALTVSFNAKTATTTSVSSSANPSTYGQSVSFTATLTPSGATGTVQFVVDGSNFGSPVTVSGGAAVSGTTAALSAGNHTVTANFTGTGIYANSSGSLSGGQTVNKALLSITASSATVTYGDPAPAITPGFSGFVNGETSAVLATQPACTTAYTSTSSVGSSPSTSCSGAAAANYSFSYVPGTVTINKASVTITASSPTVSYNDPVPAITPGFGAFKNGETSAVLTTQPACITTYTTTSSVGSSPSTSCSGAVATNYDFSYVPGTVTINKASVTITASSPTVTYSDPAPAITPGFGAFKNGDTSAVLTTQPICSTTYTTTSNAGSSPSTSCSGAAAANYSFSYVPGAVTINKASVTITASSATVTYGDPAPAITASFSAFKNGDTSAVLTTQPTCTTAYTATSSVGSSPATSCSSAVAANYSFSYVPGTVTINKASVTITASSATASYGDPVPAITPNFIGFKNGETSAVLTTQPVCTTAYTTTSSVGTSPATSCSGAVATNYSFSYVPGAVTINKASVTITASSLTVAYGDAVPAITPGFGAFKNSETSAVLTTQPVCTTAYTTTSNAGTSPATSCSSAAAANYNFSYIPGAVTINKASVTITASSATVNYGDPAPAITASFSAFKNGDTSAVLTTQPTCTTAYTATSSVGSSPATSCSGAVATNYSFSYVPGAVAINKVSVTITASSATVNYGDPAPAITASFSAFKNGDTSTVLTTQPTCTTAYTTTSSVGTSPATSCSGAVATNYSFSYVPGAVTINKASVTITASSLTVAYGDAVPAITPGFGAFKNGDTSAVLTTQPTCNTTYTTTSNAGTSPATSCSSAAAANYNFSYIPGAVTINKASVTITASSATVAYGDPVPAITASFSAFKNGETNAVLTTQPVCATAYTTTSGIGSAPSTSCSGAAAANYSFSYIPGTVTVGAVSVTITASSPTVTFGDPAPAITPSFGAFKNGDTSAVLTTQPTCTTTYTGTSSVGSSPATNCSGAVAANYTFTYVPGVVTINKVSVTITASNATATYGDPVPVITPGFGAFKNGDTSSVLTTQPACTTAYTATSSVGSSPATSCSGAVATNYAFSYVPGAVTINKASVTATASSPTVAFGDPVPAITPSFSGFKNNETGAVLTTQPTCTTTYTTTSSIGSSPSTSCSGAAAANYTFSYIPGAVTVDADPPPSIQKAFGDASIPAGTATSLTFTITAPASHPVSGVSFVDSFPSGMVVAAPNALNPPSGCNGTVPAAIPGSATVSLTGASLAAGATCSFTVSVIGNTVGTYDNSVTVNSDQGTGNTSHATLDATTPLSVTAWVRHFVDIAAADSYIDLTNDGANLVQASSNSSTRNICVNVYTFDSNEELVSCCACPITPNGVKSLSVKNDLLSNTLTPGVPQAVVVKLIATTPVLTTTDGSTALSTACDATVTPGYSLSNGLQTLAAKSLHAWGTTPHLNSATGAYQLVDTEFSKSSLTGTELSQLAGSCGFINSVGSGFGICKSCAVRGLGAVRQ